MPWVHFNADFDYRIARRAVTFCKGGGTFLVKQDVADEAVALGVGVLVDRPDELPPPLKKSRKGRRRGV